MLLAPLDDGTLGLAAGWLAEKSIYQWLDFGLGHQRVTAASLKIMAGRDIHCLRLYQPEEADRPIGLVALSNISRPFKSATLWALLGERRYGGRGHPFRAASRLLTYGFDQLGLRVVHAWAVEHNHASIRNLRRLGFQCMGRQRRCHYIDGQPYDRLLFDLLAEEHRVR